MARVFISYCREDKPVVELLYEGLNHAGHKVWWDVKLMAADAFREAIESQIAAADVVVVVWSKRAKASRFVVDEAERAVDRGVFLPLCLDGQLPLGFGSFNALDFSGWGGDYNSDEWRRLLIEISRIAAMPLPPWERPPLTVVAHALFVAAAWGVMLGLATWALYGMGTSGDMASDLGHPLVDAVLLCALASTPVALYSAFETRRSGFDKISLIVRRSFVWFGCGGGIALVIIALAASAGVLEPPRGGAAAAAEFVRAFLIIGAASASVVTALKLSWAIVGRAFRVHRG